jgi:TolB protein
MRMKLQLSNRSQTKAFAVCVFSSLILSAFAATGPQKIAFQRGDNIWIASIDGMGAKKIAIGSEPSISSTGTQVVFITTTLADHRSQARGAPNDRTRRIAIADVTSGKITTLKNIPSDGCSSPVWSPDGQWIIFSSGREFLGDSPTFYDLNVIKKDDTGFRVIVKGTEVGHPMYYSPCWAPDGRSLFCHSSNKICRLGPDGAVLEQWDIRKILPDYFYLTGNISVSFDGNRLLISQEYRGDSEAPPPSLWLFDLVSQQSTRLVTPKELLVSGACWLDRGHILFQSGGADESDRSAIYRMSLDGKDLKRLIKNGSSPTVSAP